MLISEYLVLHKCFIELIKLCSTSFCLAPEASRDVQVLIGVGMGRFVPFPLGMCKRTPRHICLSMLVEFIYTFLVIFIGFSVKSNG